MTTLPRVPSNSAVFTRPTAWLRWLVILLAVVPGSVLAQSPPLATPAATVPLPAIPASPVGQQLAWVLAIVNGEQPMPIADELTQHFASDFLAALPPDQLLNTFTYLAGAIAPAAVGRFEGAVTATDAVALLATPGESWRVTIGVLATPGHPIENLFFAPAPLPAPPPNPPTSWPAFDKQLASYAPKAAVTAAELKDDTCQVIHEQGSSQELAIASNFKLYVLGELARQIEQGKASWDEPWAIRTEWQSLPSGTMQDDPAGTLHTLLQYAENMISLSDNTAADHLMHFLGRTNIEANLAAMGHSAPKLDEPLLYTREFFALKSALPASVAAEYIAASPQERRQLLATVVDPVSLAPAWSAVWDSPIDIDTIEWFASTHDLCNAMAALKRLSAQPGLAPVREILSINPGLPLDPRVWAYVGFKGGDETGVMSRTWLLQRRDGRWFVLSVILNDPVHPIDETSVTSLLVSALNLLAKTR